VKYISYIIAIGAISFALINIFDNNTPPSVTPDTVTVTRVDTIFAEPEFIYIPKYVAKVHYDTIFQTDTVYLTKVAELDTSFKEGELNVKYFYVPEMFSLTWNPSQIPTIKETEYIETTVSIPYTPKWWEKPSVVFLGGFIGGVLIGTR